MLSDHWNCHLRKLGTTISKTCSKRSKLEDFRYSEYFLYFTGAFLNFESNSKILRSKRCRFGVSRFGLAGFKRKFRKTENWTARVFTVGVKWKSIFAFSALKLICIRVISALNMHRNKMLNNNTQFIRYSHSLTLYLIEEYNFRK